MIDISATSWSSIDESHYLIFFLQQLVKHETCTYLDKITHKAFKEYIGISIHLNTF